MIFFNFAAVTFGKYDFIEIFSVSRIYFYGWGHHINLILSKIAKYCSGCGFALPNTETVKTEAQTTKPVSITPVKQNKLLTLIVAAIAFVVCFFAPKWLFKGS